jgi:hypothetical protein
MFADASNKQGIWSLYTYHRNMSLKCETKFVLYLHIAVVDLKYNTVNGVLQKIFVFSPVNSVQILNGTFKENKYLQI